MREKLELVDKDVKTTITNMFHVFKKGEEMITDGEGNGRYKKHLDGTFKKEKFLKGKIKSEITLNFQYVEICWMGSPWIKHSRRKDSKLEDTGVK